MDAIRRSVYADLQDFIQKALRDPLRKAVKNKGELARRWVVICLTNFIFIFHIPMLAYPSWCEMWCMKFFFLSAEYLFRPAVQFVN